MIKRYNYVLYKLLLFGLKQAFINVIASYYKNIELTYKGCGHPCLLRKFGKY